MKELIEYNYNLTIDDIEETDNLSSFNYNDELYLFVPYYRSIKELNDIISCSNELISKHEPVMLIIINKFQNPLVKYQETNYLLLKCNRNYRDQVDLTEIIKISQKTYLIKNKASLYRNNWGNLWSEKIDYLEYQVRELGQDKKIILDSFSYYAGLGENAIELVNHTTESISITNYDRLSLCHHRIFYPNYNLNYYNPLSFIFDLEVRDIAEYLKYCFFAGDNAFLELKTYLEIVKLGRYSYQLLFARLLYPSYYFDEFSLIIENNVSQDKLLSIIKKVNDYEEFLKKAYKEISKYALLEKIEWLNS